jgi:hypothetical protein
MGSNWTKKELNEISDKDFIIGILHERLNKVNNYSFLGRKIKKVLKSLDNVDFIEKKEEESENRTIKVLQHKVEYWFRNDNYEGELNDCDEEHIKEMIIDGYNQGELCSCPDGENSYYGWWKIV